MTLENLKDPQNVVILTTAPAGFGHMRVTLALQDGFPQDVSSSLLGATDPTLTYLHRLSSLNFLVRGVQEFVQNHPLLEEIFADNYRAYLRNNPIETETQLTTLLTTHYPPPKVAVVVATHFGLAHEIASLKPLLEEKTKIKIILLVIVTDDTFQKVWAVDGADVIFIPSGHSQEQLKNYFQKKKRPLPEIIVNCYPISPKLALKLETVFESRQKQLDPTTTVATHLLIPISGAAVQLATTEKIIAGLKGEETKPFQISVVSKQAPFTKIFLKKVSSNSHLKVITATTDLETVKLYEGVFGQSPPPTLELTKPSEQSFKALFTPKQLGGVILLMSEPVGRQEVDNLNFFKRHGLIPTDKEQAQLEIQLTQKQPNLENALLEKAQNWRGLMLPKGPPSASITFIKNARRLGLFTKMLAFKRSTDPELQTNGVAKFWQKVNSLLA